MRALLISGLLSLIAFPLVTLAHDSPEALQQAFVAAVMNNDADALAACYAPDAVNFPIDSMIDAGPDSVRESWQAFFSEYRIDDISLSDERLEVSGDLAVAWGLFSMTATPVAGGESFEIAGRYMDVAKNVDGKWLYIADHASVPSN